MKRVTYLTPSALKMTDEVYLADQIVLSFQMRQGVA